MPPPGALHLEGVFQAFCGSVNDLDEIVSVAAEEKALSMRVISCLGSDPAYFPMAWYEAGIIGRANVCIREARMACNDIQKAELSLHEALKSIRRMVTVGPQSAQVRTGILYQEKYHVYESHATYVALHPVPTLVVPPAPSPTGLKRPRQFKITQRKK